MKKLLIPVITYALTFTLNAQTTVLRYATHALKIGVDNPMSYCQYADPGQAGNNVTWDFSGLKFTKSFTGYIRNSAFHGNQSIFSRANTELQEFSSRFYFDVNDQEIDQYGYASADGGTIVKYTTPFVKIKYPFEYGDFYTGTFQGISEYQNVKNADISGNYSVDADANGTLILPGDVVFKNTLRVKTTKTYTMQFSVSSQKINIVTYRWYDSAHRYPLLVLTEITTVSGSNSFKTHQAAYNNNVVSTPKSANSILASQNFELYPNPVKSSLTVSFDAVSQGSLAFEIYDMSGKLQKSFQRNIVSNGSNQYDISDELQGLRPATYLLVVIDGESRFGKEFTLVR